MPLFNDKHAIIMMVLLSVLYAQLLSSSKAAILSSSIMRAKADAPSCSRMGKLLTTGATFSSTEVHLQYIPWITTCKGLTTAKIWQQRKWKGKPLLRCVQGVQNFRLFTSIGKADADKLCRQKTHRLMAFTVRRKFPSENFAAVVWVPMTGNVSPLSRSSFRQSVGGTPHGAVLSDRLPSAAVISVQSESRQRGMILHNLFRKLDGTSFYMDAYKNGNIRILIHKVGTTEYIAVLRFTEQFTTYANSAQQPL